LGSRAEEQAILTAWPVDRPADWVERVNRGADEKEMEALRRSVQRGRPCGATEWQRGIAKRLGLESSNRSPGRPEIGQGRDQLTEWECWMYVFYLANIGPVPFSDPRFPTRTIGPSPERGEIQ